jgi:uncharacterized membrane protein
MMDGYDIHGWGWAMMLVWSLIAIGFLGIVVWFATQLGRGGSPPVPGSSASPKPAQDVLDDRLALGEIDVDEYQRRRDALERGNRERAPT